MKERAFVIAAFGDRSENIPRLCKNIRQYFDYPIHIITTGDSNIGMPIGSPNMVVDKVYIQFVERHWCSTGHPREDIRNSNYHKIKFAVDHHYDSFCLLDDDMFIWQKDFVDGFAIAERFGVAAPLNPRVYVKYNAMGAGVQHQDLVDITGQPLHAPACNFSPMFVYPHVGYTSNFLGRLLIELRDKPCRGTLAIWKASWESQFTPVYLPEQYCVCGENAQYFKDYVVQLRGRQVKIPIMCLHLGHEKVKEVFGIN